MGELALRHTYSNILSDRRALGLTFAALCLALPSRAVAQRRNCAQARAVLLNETSTRTESYVEMATMVNCGDAAPGTIVKMLRQFAPRSAGDTLARQGAWALLDTRLVDSIGVLALDVNQTTERRLFFLRLLTRSAALNAAVDDRGIHNPETPSVLLAAGDAGGVLGTSPPTAESRKRARATIQTMGLRDPDPTLRKLAGLVYEELKYYMPYDHQ